MTSPGADAPIVAVDLDEVLYPFVATLNDFCSKQYNTTHRVSDYHSYHFADVWQVSDRDAAERVRDFLSSPAFTGSVLDSAAASSEGSPVTGVAALRVTGAVPPLRGAVEVLHSFLAVPPPGSGAFPRGGGMCTYRFFIVTSRSESTMRATHAWVNTHFPGVFEGILFGNHYAEDAAPPAAGVAPTTSTAAAATGAVRSKADMCAQLGATILIDDNIAYARQCAGTVQHVLLFGAYPWNHDPTSTEGMRAASSSTSTSSASPAAHADTTPLPDNVIRVINWRHAGSVLGRLRPRGLGVSRAALPLDAYGLNTPAVTRDSVLVNTSIPLPALTAPGVHAHRRMQRPAHVYTELARRLLEVRDVVTVTGTGDDCNIVAETASALLHANDAVIVSVHPGVDSAPPGQTRYPRLTMELRRTPGFLQKRFRSMAGVAGRVGGDGVEEGGEEEDEEDDEMIDGLDMPSGSADDGDAYAQVHAAVDGQLSAAAYEDVVREEGEHEYAAAAALPHHMAPGQGDDGVVDITHAVEQAHM